MLAEWGKHLTLIGRDGRTSFLDCRTKDLNQDNLSIVDLSLEYATSMALHIQASYPIRPCHPTTTETQFPHPSLHHFSTPGLISISHVKLVFGCVCRCQYASAMASGSIFASLANPYACVRGMSMTPSMTACATCTPWGPNSRARDCERARRACFMVAKAAKRAEPFTEAVAPVKIREGGCGDVLVAERRRGRVACEKRKDPLL